MLIKSNSCCGLSRLNTSQLVWDSGCWWCDSFTAVNNLMVWSWVFILTLGVKWRFVPLKSRAHCHVFSSQLIHSFTHWLLHSSSHLQGAGASSFSATGFVVTFIHLMIFFCFLHPVCSFDLSYFSIRLRLCLLTVCFFELSCSLWFFFLILKHPSFCPSCLSCVVLVVFAACLFVWECLTSVSSRLLWRKTGL